MECKKEIPGLEIETDTSIYEIEFGQIQIEVTGRCNMRCLYCRASNQPAQDMPIEQIIKTIRFARQFSPDYKEIIISGGEPFVRRDFNSILEQIRESGGEFVTLTTNGSLLKSHHLDTIERLAFPRFVFSVSVDSVNSQRHNDFRGYEGAFQKALSALCMVAERNIPNVVVSMRSTILADQIGEMDRLTELACNLGCKRISFSDVRPAGRAIGRSDFWMTKEQKLDFLRKIYNLKISFPDMNITTNDVLKCLLRGRSDMGEDGELVFDGCGAAVITFNVKSDGTMTPCALLDIPMMNIFPLSIEEITEEYRRSPIVKDMLEMNLKGKCSDCQMKYQCGGCRARAYIQTGDFLEEDPHCWV